MLRDSNINGHDYMRNIVHLPVFLNSRGLSNARKFLVTSATNGDISCSEATGKYQALECSSLKAACRRRGLFSYAPKG